jgi:NADH-quinone oxidoreductase subunit J
VSVLFYISGAVSLIGALMVITRRNAMHALVNLIVTFLAIACSFWTLGAPFAAALQIVVYAGAIMVLFVFAVMILNLSPEAGARGSLVAWIVPIALALVLLVEIAVVLIGAPGVLRQAQHAQVAVGPAAVGESLFTVYALGVEIASVLLLAGLVAAFHYGVIPSRLGGDDE